MALIVEDGSIVAGAESYCSASFADTYHANRANTAWDSVDDKEAALRKATDYMMQEYRGRWKGVRMSSTQALDWPRGYVYLDPVITGANQEFPNLVASDIVPNEVKAACAELALKSVQGELSPDIEQKKISESVGPLSVTYSQYGNQYTQYRAIDNILALFLASSTGGAFRQVVRT